MHLIAALLSIPCREPWEYAQEARPLIEKNREAAHLRKGAYMRELTHRKHGHSLAEAYVVHQRSGYIKRNCRTCWTMRVDRAVITPEVAKRSKLSYEGAHR